MLFFVFISLLLFPKSIIVFLALSLSLTLYLQLQCTAFSISRKKGVSLFLWYAIHAYHITQSEQHAVHAAS